ncbi:MAG: nuclear transport factor 2 family protein [Mucilaginibacter sp.]
MKKILTLTLILIAGRVFAQSQSETEILNLSKTIFSWETQGKIDSLAGVFDEKFVVVGSTGEAQTKDQYIARLKSGSFVHNSIDVEENKASVVNTTATVVGKGKFTVTVSGNKVTLHLAYIEVFTKYNSGWKILAMHASVLQN